MSIPDEYFNRCAPSPQEIADYEEYLASLPKHGEGSRYDEDQDDRSDELLDFPMDVAPEGIVSPARAVA